VTQDDGGGVADGEQGRGHTPSQTFTQWMRHERRSSPDARDIKGWEQEKSKVWNAKKGKVHSSKWF